MRKRTNWLRPFLFLACSFLALTAFAQRAEILLDPPDVAQLRSEDERSPGTRFAAPISTSLRTNEVGRYTEAGYELVLQAPGALGLGVFLDEIQLPTGGALYLENDSGRRGPYTGADVSEQGRLFTDFLPGEVVRLDYRGPLPANKGSLFRVWRVDYAYHPDRFQPKMLMFGFGTSNACHENVNCPTGAGWTDEQRSTCRIIVVVEEGTGYCTGTLLNNTAEDAKPYLLTGFHCQDGYSPLYDLWRFDFGYLAPDCANPPAEPTYTALTGAIRRAGRRENDFLLLELTDTDLDANLLHFSGWDRSESWDSPGAALLHHPRGDVQKISTIDGSVQVFGNSINWNNGVVTPPNHHWDMQFGTGTFEIGSSGAALFDSEHRVRGQLHGGNPSCPGTTQAWCGRLALAWIGGGAADSRLSDWLDPTGNAPLTLDALGATATVLGGSVAKNDQALAGVRLIWTTPNRTDTTYSDALGQFERPTFSAGTNVTLRVERDDTGNNGVSTLDIALSRKHLLQLQIFDDSLQVAAADANGNGDVSSLDFIKMQRVILALQADFAPFPEWIFLPVAEESTFLTPTIGNEWSFTVPQESDWRIQFRAAKRGDVNYSASVVP